LLDYFTVYTGNLNQYVGQNGCHDQLPHTFYPQVNYIPPVELVTRQVFRVVEGKQEQQRQTNQTGHHHYVYRSFTTFKYGHTHVVQERQRHNHDPDLGWQRLLQELASHGGKDVVTGHLGKSGIGHKQVAQDGQHTSYGKHPEHQDCQLGAVQFAV